MRSSHTTREYSVFRCERRRISQGKLEAPVPDGHDLFSCVNDKIDDRSCSYAMRASWFDDSG
jgi:hypothetical protein